MTIARLLLPVILALLLAACGTPPTSPDPGPEPTPGPDPDPTPQPVVACTDPDEVVTFPDEIFSSYVYWALDLEEGTPIRCGALAEKTRLQLDPRYLRAPYEIRSLAGVEHFRNLEQVTILKQNVLPDSEFARLGTLHTITKVHIADVPLLESVSWLANMPDFEQLTLDDTGVTSLEGIEELYEMHTLWVRGNLNLTSVEPVANLRKLRTVQLTGSGVTSLAPFSGNHTLLELMAANNALTEVSLSGMTALTNLSVALNQLTEVPALSDMPSLTILGLTGNNLTDLAGLEGMRLSQLHAGNNKLTTIEHIADLAGVRNLYLHDNLITDVTPLASVSWTSIGLRSALLTDNCIDNENGTLPLGPNNDAVNQLRSEGINVQIMPQATDGRCTTVTAQSADFR